MSKDDFDVIVFKLLSYLYECLKHDVEPNLEKMQEVAGCNATYFKAVMQSLEADNYIIGKMHYAFCGTAVAFTGSLSQAGANYVNENSRMAEVRKFLGEAWPAVLRIAIEATKALYQ